MSGRVLEAYVRGLLEEREAVRAQHERMQEGVEPPGALLAAVRSRLASLDFQIALFALGSEQRKETS